MHILSAQLQAATGGLDSFPPWLSAIGIMFTVAAVLAAAAAEYRTRVSKSTIDKLRGDIIDWERRDLLRDKTEETLQGDIRILQAERQGDTDRIRVLEDLLTHRTDDAEIRQGIADLKRTVDDELRAMLLRIEGEVRAIKSEEGGTAHA